MTRTTGTIEIADNFTGLFGLYPLRPIKDEVDYGNVLEIARELIPRRRLNKDQRDYLETLTLLIEKYENEHHNIDTDSLEPIEILKYILEEKGWTGSDLGRLLGQRQLGSAILRGKRNLSKTHIKILADYFKVNPRLFLS